MPLRIREIHLRPGESEELLSQHVATAVGIKTDDILELIIVRRGIDARRKSDVRYVYTLDFCCRDESGTLERNRHLNNLLVAPKEHTIESLVCRKKDKVLIVGMGPAGLFAALTLAQAGAEVCLIERGKPVEERWRDVRSFWAGGGLNEQSNIQFGEGGAGTFSDGKLTCRLNHPATGMVLERLVSWGAPAEIMIQAKPHIGSDRLRAVLINLRRELIDAGVEMRFSSQLTAVEEQGGRVVAGVINDEENISCDHLIMATGHSARDTYEMLNQHGVALTQKPFAIGLRVEHPRELINRIQYGRGHNQLPAADYRLNWNDKDSGRGVYSFCMCPGGSVVNGSSEEGALVVNGMSNLKRDDEWSNSALVVTVNEDDFPGSDPLAGVKFQRHWEQQAYRLAGANWSAPAQSLQSFLHGGSGDIHSSCLPGVTESDLNLCLPVYVSDALRRALPYFNQRMRGFCDHRAVLIGVETRTSAPVRIVRDETLQSINLQRLYPCGEGAGYAGGIMSAALDGIRVATGIIKQI